MPASVTEYIQSPKVRSDLSDAKRVITNQFLLSNGQPRPYSRQSVPGPASDKNVVGVGVSEKIIGGNPTGIMSVTIFVQMKFPIAHIPQDYILPQNVSGIETDVQEIGLILPLSNDSQSTSPRQSIRPLRAGSSIGFNAPNDAFETAGTLGGIVTADGIYYLLSNNHVLADEGRLPVGAPIYQPALLDGADWTVDRVAALTRLIPFTPGGANRVDAAIARIDDGILADTSGLGQDPPRGVRSAQLGAQVSKNGRTSGFTVGTVTSIDTDIRMPYGTGTYLFEGQIAISGAGMQFSSPGDSGALLIERTSGNAVGLLFGGGPTLSFGNHIESVLSALEVELVTL